MNNGYPKDSGYATYLCRILYMNKLNSSERLIAANFCCFVFLYQDEYSIYPRHYENMPIQIH